MIPKDNFTQEVLISSLKNARTFDCMFGFFNSAALRSIAPGLSEFLLNSTRPMRLVVSPNLSSEDTAAIRAGIFEPQEIIENRLIELFGEAKLSTSALVKYTLSCLSYMLSTNRLEFRVVWLRDGALFHPKVWIFGDEENKVVAHGSSNFTDAGIGRNHEQVSIATTWYDNRSNTIVETLEEEFSVLWIGDPERFYTLPLPLAIKHDLIHEYRNVELPTTQDFENALRKDLQVIETENLHFRGILEPYEEKLTIPDYLDMHSGPFSHQGKAIEAWEKKDRRGFLSMATGSGKTITALAAATRLQDCVDRLLVIVSAPYKPLVSQWVDEIRQFGVEPLPINGSIKDRAQMLDFAIRGLESGANKVKVMVVTNNFLVSSNFRHCLAKLTKNVTSLLIADEAHNLGIDSFLSRTPDRFDCRLGLSATPERQYDPEGTQHLFEYFGEPVFEFSMEDAIGVCLVPYHYYIHQVSMTDEEFENWTELTEKLRRKGFKNDVDPSESGKLPEEVKKLLIARRRLIESAENKVGMLKQILQNRTRDNVKHVLVYATDKNPTQLNSVNGMLQNDLNFTIHQLTADETASRARSATILERFADGDYHIITCKRVLDEGVDVPQIREAYILASNTVKRQWIQRRGRILRKCDEINKKFANLHDFMLIPPNPKSKESKSILFGELERVRAFTELAENAGTPGGPLDEIDKLMRAMF